MFPRWRRYCCLFQPCDRASTAAEPPRSGHAVFDRAVRLVMDNFHDTSALDRFAEAVRREIGDPQSPIDAAASNDRVDAAIDAVLASLHGIPYGSPGTRHDRLFRDRRRVPLRHPRRHAPAVSAGWRRHLSRHRHDRSTGRRALFVSDVYDGSPAAKAGILAGDEIVSVDGAPYREIAFVPRQGRPERRRQTAAQPGRRADRGEGARSSG